MGIITLYLPDKAVLGLSKLVENLVDGQHYRRFYKMWVTSSRRHPISSYTWCLVGKQMNLTLWCCGVHLHACELSCSVMCDSATLWTIAHQAPLSMEFSRQEYCSGLPFPSPRNFPDPGIEPRSRALLADSLLSEPPTTAQTNETAVSLSLLLRHIWTKSVCQGTFTQVNKKPGIKLAGRQKSKACVGPHHLQTPSPWQHRHQIRSQYTHWDTNLLS